MQEQFTRTKLLLGIKAIDTLATSRVAVFGVGGVGGYVVEALARSGVGTLDIIDSDTVNITNINRQIIATMSTVGRYKVDVFTERIHDINPLCNVNAHRTFYLPENALDFDFTLYDYVVDAVDTIAAKMSIIERAKASGVPVISSMGAGGKTDPGAFMVADIYETSVCPLAKVIRTECRKRGITSLRVVYSRETPIKPPSRDVPIGSVAFVPSVAGMMIAGEVIKDLIK